MSAGKKVARYKWTNPATKLLISIWSTEEMQNQLQACSRPQPIWDSIARYLTKKGFPVSGSQCRTRIKNMTSLYQEAVVSGDTSALEPYFDVFHKNIPAKKKAKVEKGTNQSAIQKKDIDDEEFEMDVSQVGLKNNVSLGEATQNLKDEDEPQYCTVDSTSLEVLISRSLASQLAAFKKFMNTSILNLERMMESHQESLEALLAEYEQKQRHLDDRLDRLLSKIEATAVPQLTYMGPLAAERKADEN